MVHKWLGTFVKEKIFDILNKQSYENKRLTRRQPKLLGKVYCTQSKSDVENKNLMFPQICVVVVSLCNVNIGVKCRFSSSVFIVVDTIFCSFPRHTVNFPNQKSQR